MLVLRMRHQKLKYTEQFGIQLVAAIELTSIAKSLSQKSAMRNCYDYILSKSDMIFLKEEISTMYEPSNMFCDANIGIGD